MRVTGRAVVTGLMVLIASAASTKAEDAHYSLVVGRTDTHAYAVGVGISMLAKINILPRYNVDLDVLVSDDSAESVARLMAGEAALAMVDPKDLDPAMADEISSVAMIWHSGETSPLLAARKEVPSESVYQITKTIFENLPSLQTIDPITAKTNLDAAVVDLSLPLHDGAKRYYREVAVALPDAADPNVTAAQAPTATAPSDRVTDAGLSDSPPSRVAALLPAVLPVDTDAARKRERRDQEGSALAEFFSRRATRGGIGAKTFVVYFGTNEATLDGRSRETLAELESFATQLGDARAWVAGFTDSVGPADYNIKLAKRRVNAVVEALDKIGLKANIEVNAPGDSSPWILRGDHVREAFNRRVEIVVELAPGSADQYVPHRSGAEAALSDSLM